MLRTGSRQGWRLAILSLAATALTAVDCPAIEMFTFFGDGSRVGLPSLEVPIEAYPGIPLRSYRLRARRRAKQLGPGGAVRIGPPGYARGITIRSMPTTPQPDTFMPLSSSPPLAAEEPTEEVRAVEVPMAPEPEEVTPR